MTPFALAAPRVRSLLVLALLAACVDQPFAPGPQAPATLRLGIILPAATPPVWTSVGESLHVAIRRAGQTAPILDTAFIITDTAAVALAVPLDHAVEQFVASAEVRYGAMALFIGFDAVLLTAGADTAITLAAAYIGPGAGAASYALAARDSTLSGGDTASLRPVVLDSSGQVIPNVPVRYRVAGPAQVSVDSSGVLLAAAASPADTAQVTGFLPMGLSSAVTVRVVPNIAPPAMRLWLGCAGTTAADSTDWFNAANWDPAAVPGSTDSVSITDSDCDPVVGGRASAAALRVEGGILSMAHGTLDVAGDFTTSGGSSGGSLAMSHADDTVRIGGTATFDGRLGNGLSDGVLVVRGDFTQHGTSFQATGNHRTVLDGAAPQELTMAASHTGSLAHFRHLDIANTAGQIIIGHEDAISVTGKLRVLRAITIDNGAGGNGDATLEVGDSLVMASGSRLTVVRLRLGGGMAVAGDFAPQAGGSFLVDFAGPSQRIQAGLAYRDVKVSGDAFLGGNEVFDGALQIEGALTIGGHTLTVTSQLMTDLGSGRLIMTSPADTVSVRGGAMFRGDSLPGDLTAGVLRLGGSFTSQAYVTKPATFRATPPHRTIFDGPAMQGINSTHPALFGDLVIANDSGVMTVLEQGIQVGGSLRITTPVALGGGAAVSVADSVITVPGSTLAVADLAVRGGLAIAGGYDVGSLRLMGTQQDLPAGLPYQSVIVHGSARLTGRTSASQVSVIDGGALSLAGHTLVLSGMFNVGSANLGDTSTVTMQQAAESLIVGGDAYFAGGPTDGLLTAGTLLVRGPFYQLFNASAFQPSGTFRTVLDGSAIQDVWLEHGGSGSAASWFNHLDLANNIALTGTAPVRGMLRTLSAGQIAVIGSSAQLSAEAADLVRVRMDGTALSLGAGPITRLDSLEFTNQDPAAVQLSIAHPGAATPLTFTGIEFTTTPTSGAYIAATDVAPADGNTLTITLAQSQPPDGSSHTTTGGGAVVTWAGAVPSPFAALPNLTAARANHRSVLLDDGTVLVVGGSTTIGELFNPASGQFSLTGGAATRVREGLTATKLYDGRVLLTGGGQGLPATRTAEIYDPATQLFALTDSLGDSIPVAARGRRFHTATLLPSGEVLVVGGEGVNVNVLYRLLTAETWSFISEQFTVRARPARARSRHVAALLPNNRVLICGGQTNFMDTGDSHCEVYNASADTWSAAGNMTKERVNPTATVLPNGKVLITGGNDLRQDPLRRLASAELYDPATGTFTATGSMAARRQYHEATLLANGLVLITGGLDENNIAVTAAELYDPATGTFSPAGAMVAGRHFHSAVLLPNSKVLLTGGQTAGTSAEIYTP